MGDDNFSLWILRRLEATGAEAGGVEITLGQPMGLTARLTRQDGERAFITYRGHMEHLKADHILKRQHLWQEAGCLMIAGYFLLPGLGFEGTREVMQAARKHGKALLFDIGSDVEEWPPRVVEEVLRLLE